MKIESITLIAYLFIVNLHSLVKFEYRYYKSIIAFGCFWTVVYYTYIAHTLNTKRNRGETDRMDKEKLNVSRSLTISLPR